GGRGVGFLGREEKRCGVVQNRHVVENGRKGFAVEFGDKKGAPRLTISPKQTEVVAIHRSADLAIIDVSKAAAEIEKTGLVPVLLAPAGYSPEVGEDVFAIGHPGAGEGTLPLTTTTGSVSGVDRPHPDKE